jgi:hypothetical protein
MSAIVRRTHHPAKLLTVIPLINSVIDYLIYHRKYGYAKALELEKDLAAYRSGG